MSAGPGQADLIAGASGPFEVVIGLEVHAQVRSQAKLFSGASAAFGGAPNCHVSPIDAGMPGMLPSVNRFCIEQAVRTGLGLKAQVNRVSVFERKNYFYPDLPAGYQISQYAQPIVGHGQLVIDRADGRSRSIGITRLHLEMDAGKSLHDQRPDATLVDLNRSGVALMEIVSEPDLRSAEEAIAFMRKLRSILRYLGTAMATWRRARSGAMPTSRCAGRRRRSAPGPRSRTSTRCASSAARSSTRRAGRSS